MKKNREIRKKQMVWMLVAGLVIAAIPHNVAAADSTVQTEEAVTGLSTTKCGDHASYSVSGDTLQITGYGELYDNDSVSQNLYPKSVTTVIIGNGITGIGGSDFSEFTNLQSVSFPSTLKEIGSLAFQGCKNLKKITLPANLKTIGWKAFEGSGLTTIQIPKSVTSIEQQAFSNCVDLKTASIGAKKTGEASFQGCIQLETVITSEGLESFASRTFQGCSKLKKITLSSTVKTIGNAAFLGCDALEDINVAEQNGSFCSYDGCLYSKEGTPTLIQCPPKKTQISFLSGITAIGSSAFYGCKELKSISIPSTVQSIGSYAFADCTGLEEVKIPDSVTTMEMAAFNGSGISEVKIGTGISSIKVSVFAECKNLSNIVIPSNVRVIGDMAFKGCSSLGNVKISEGVQEIGTKAFYDCTNLKQLCVPESVTKIWEQTFGFKSPDRTSVSGFTLIGYTGSEAERYAKVYNVKFEEAGDHEHEYQIKSEQKASCISEGKIIYECSVCHKQYTTVYPAYGHSFAGEKIIKKASPTKNGAVSQKCLRCGKMETQQIIYAASQYRLSQNQFEYNGTSKCPDIFVTDKNGNTIDSTQYKVNYENNKLPGKATIVIEFTGGLYTGKKQVFFVIKPKNTEIVGVYAKKKSFVVKWKKRNKQISGYQLQYADNMQFKKAKTKKISNLKTTTLTQKKLHSKTIYYVRLRTYKLIKTGGTNKTYYSDWGRVVRVYIK